LEWEKRQKPEFKHLSDQISSKFVIEGTNVQSQPQSAIEAAASLNMFGKFTRTTENWKPEGLLCKRFNVKNPWAGKKNGHC